MPPRADAGLSTASTSEKADANDFLMMDECWRRCELGVLWLAPAVIWIGGGRDFSGLGGEMEGDAAVEEGCGVSPVGEESQP